MKRVIAITVAVAALMVLTAYADDSQHTISVSGKAEEKVKPDVAYITLYAQANGILMVDAVQKADKLIAEITTAIKTETNVIKNIAVVDVALGEKTREYWRSDQKEEVPRPQVARRILITCKPVPVELYEVIDKAIRAGGLLQIPSQTSYSDDIRSAIIYGLEESAAVLDRVRQSAMDNARAEATKLAQLAGKSVGSLVTICSSATSHFNFPVRVMGKMADFPTEHIGTNPEEIIISHSVSVTYELKD